MMRGETDGCRGRSTAHRPARPTGASPTCGGQGVYIRHLSKALVDLGHHVEVLGGQPYPDRSTSGSRWSSCRSLDIYNDHFPMRMPGVWELKSFADWLEVTVFSHRHLPRAAGLLACGPGSTSGTARDEFDLVHDNQSLGYGLLAHRADGPARARARSTTRSPSTAGSRSSTPTAWYKRFAKSPLVRVHQDADPGGRRLRRVLTVSENSFDDIVADHEVDPDQAPRRARRRRPRPLHPAAGRRAEARPAHHHRHRPTWP